jgi:antitoxin component of MazEF toxin-antitoxin module
MTVIVRSSKQDEIVMPDHLMLKLNLHDGDEVKTIIEGNTLRLTPMKQFLALRGALKDDDGFDDALSILDKAWQSWTQPPSV